MDSNRFGDVITHLWPYLRSANKDQKLNESIRDSSLLYLKPHMLELQLTPAEARLLRVGMETGRASYVEYNQILSPNNIIRSEILNWILKLPLEFQHIYRQNALQIESAFFLTMNQYLAFKKNGSISEENVDVLDISSTEINIDLKFVNCEFKGGVNLGSAKLNNLTFEACRFGTGAEKTDAFYEYLKYNPSIYAHQTIFRYSFCIIGSTDIIGKSRKSYRSDFKGELILTHARVNQSLVIHEVQSNKDILCYFGKFNLINIWALTTINSRVSFVRAVANSMYISSSWLTANKGEDGDSGIAFNATGLKSLKLDVKNVTVLGAFICKEANFEKSFSCRSSILISPKKAKLKDSEDQCLDISNSVIDDVDLSEQLATFGIVSLNNVKCRNVKLFQAKFTNYDNGKYGTAIQMNGAQIENGIRFNKKNGNTSDNRSSDEISKIIEELRPTQSSKQADGGIETFNNKAINAVIGTNVFGKLEYIENDLIPKLTENIIINNPNFIKNKTKEELIENSRKNYTIVLGEADLSGSHVGKALDCAGAIFCGEDALSDPDNAVNALNIKYLQLDGDLFLNDYESNENAPHFKAVGEVDMHSARINQFFLSPQRGEDTDTRWRITGLQYDYIYSGGGVNSQILENCNWFEDYLTQDNSFQPYQQLAAAYDKVGDDTKAKRILINARFRIASKHPVKNFFEVLLFLIISVVTFFGLPASRAFSCLLFIYAFGVVAFGHFENEKAFKYNYYQPIRKDLSIQENEHINPKNTLAAGKIKYQSVQISSKDMVKTQHGISNSDNSIDSNRVEINQWLYSLENMVPITIFYKDVYEPDFSKKVGRNAGVFIFWQKLLSITFLAMLFIGIAKIIKKDNA